MMPSYRVQIILFVKSPIVVVHNEASVSGLCKVNRGEVAQEKKNTKMI